MLKRRTFFKQLFGLAASLGLSIPAAKACREPYVRLREVVSYIGPCPGGFIGGQVVLEVKPWDGVGYPVVTRNNSYGIYAGTETYYDTDLAEFNREVPDKFWWNPENKKYPNVHAYVRTQRYGESIQEAVKAMRHRL